MRFAIRFIRRSRHARRQVSVNIADELAKQGRWIAWVSQETAQGMKRRLYLDPRKWALLGLALAVVGYGTGAVALHLWLDRRPHNQVELADLLLPWRWPGVPDKRAEGYALRGVDALEAGQVQTGIFYLQRALSGKPDNDAARLALARFYQSANYHDGVRRTVMPQLEFGASRPLLEVLMASGLAADDLDTLDEVLDREAARPGRTSEEQWWLQRWQARVAIRREEFEQALVWLEGPLLREDREMAWLRVEALLQTGRSDEAWTFASQLPRNDLEAVPLGPSLQARCQVARGDAAGLAEALRRLVEQRAAVPIVWIRAARLGADARETAVAMDYVRGYLARWGGRAQPVRQLLDEMVDSGNAEVARRAFAEAGLYQTLEPAQYLGLLLVQVQNAHWQEATTILRAVADAAAARGEAAPPWTGWIQAVLDTARTPGQRENLITVVGGMRLHLAMYRVMLDGFERTGDLTTVAALVESGRRIHPQSWQLARWSERVAAWRADGRIGEIDTAIALRAAAEEAARARQGELPADADALAVELTRLLETESWEAAGDLVRRVRRERPAPAWLSASTEVLAEAEIRSAAGRGDWLMVRQLAPNLLRRESERWSEWLMDRVERVAAEGKPELARSLAEVVRREAPEAPRALAWFEEQASTAETVEAPSP